MHLVRLSCDSPFFTQKFESAWSLKSFLTERENALAVTHSEKPSLIGDSPIPGAVALANNPSISSQAGVVRLSSDSITEMNEDSKQEKTFEKQYEPQIPVIFNFHKMINRKKDLRYFPLNFYKKLGFCYIIVW